jgi:hypothetical protein
MALERLHVVPHNNEWAVKEENKTNPESTHGTQREAIDAARELCKKNEADLVIHRPDGTIRNVYSYSEAHTANVYDDNGEDKKAADRTARDRPELRDLASVGSRISWGAILAGAAVCLSMIIALGVLCAALGLTVSNRVSDRTLFVGAMICSIVTMVTALFLGGYITSLVTAGENKMEAGIYGIVLWGTVFATLTGLTALGANVGTNALIAAKNTPVLSDEMLSQAGLDREEVARVQERLNAAAPAVSATETAWWTFGGIVLSMAASIGGSLLGSGPELVLRRRRVPADARTGRAGTRVVTTS